MYRNILVKPSIELNREVRNNVIRRRIAGLDFVYYVLVAGTFEFWWAQVSYFVNKHLTA